MRYGTFREDHPRLTLTLPGTNRDLDIKFIVDTGQQFRCPSYEIMLDWNDEPRPIEVLILEGDPLLGTILLQEYLVQMEMTEGGQVAIKPL